jgi:hypothetical protein
MKNSYILNIISLKDLGFKIEFSSKREGSHTECSSCVHASDTAILLLKGQTQTVRGTVDSAYSSITSIIYTLISPNATTIFFHSKVLVMTDHTYKKFPDRVAEIDALIQVNATFAEICADYEEMSAWLMNHCSSHSQACEECFSAMEIIKDLEAEIRQALGGCSTT